MALLAGEVPPRVAFEALLACTESFSPARLLGSGATGEVFRGVLESRPVAVKRLKLPVGATPEARAELARRFRAELAVLGSYRHARLVRLLSHAIDECPGSAHPFALVFELLDGGALSDWLRSPTGAPPARGDARLSALARVDAALGVAGGLSFLHGHREVGDAPGSPAAVVLHRDVKSANIGFALVNGSLYAKLLDCGLAKALSGGAEGGAAAGGVQSTVTIVGTPGYVAPELANKGASVATEIYSFGVVLLELLTGCQVGRTTATDVVEAAEDGGEGTLVAHAEGGVWPPPAAAALATLTLECLQTRATRRPGSCALMIERLKAVRSLVDAAASPTAQCIICLDDLPEATGVWCCASRERRHFVCCGCLQTHVTTHVEDAARLRASHGRIPCPAAGGGADGCASMWTPKDLGRVLDAGTHVTVETALLYLLFDAPRVKAEREARMREAEARAIEAGVALAEQVRRLRNVIVERDLTLHCPRCGAAFLDHSQCSALHCKENCGAAFCGLCLLDCGSNAHPHFYSVHKGVNIFDEGALITAHRTMRRTRVIAAVRALAGGAGGGALQRALVAELAKADLPPLGISVEDVLREAGVAAVDDDAPAPVWVLTWACGVCTLENALSVAMCDACGTQRPHEVGVGGREAAGGAAAAPVRQSAAAAAAAGGVIAPVAAQRAPVGGRAPLRDAVGAGFADCARGLAAIEAGRRDARALVSVLRGVDAGVAEVAHRGCEALYNISRSPAGKQACVDAGAPAAIVAAMRAHAGVADVAQWGCGVLGNIAYNSPVSQQECVDAGAPAAIVAAMRAHAGVADVALWGCGALYNIAYNSPVSQQECVDAGAPAAIVAAMRAHAGVSIIAQWGCRALQNVANSPDGQQACVDAGAPAAIVAAMLVYAGIADVVECGCGALAHIAGNPAGKRACVDVGAPVTIVAAMGAHAGVANVAEWGCWALGNITCNSPAGKQACVDAGAPAAIVAAMRAHAGVSIIAQWGCRALQSITCNSPDGKQECVDAGAPAVIVAAMRAHVGVADVARDGCWALGNIANNSFAGEQACVDAGAPAAIVAAMRASAGVADVAQWGCWALCNIASSPAGKSAINAVGGREIITAAMARHEAARERGAQALDRLR